MILSGRRDADFHFCIVPGLSLFSKLTYSTKACFQPIQPPFYIFFAPDFTQYLLVAAEYARKILTDLRRVCADYETAQTLLGYASTL